MWSLIFLILAGLCFLADASGRVSIGSIKLTPLGLFFLVVSMLLGDRKL